MTREEIEKNRHYQLTGAAFDYCRKEHPHYDGEALGEITDAFEAGAEWERKRIVEKACDWLIENFYDHPHEQYFICSESFDCIEEMVEQFMKAMEE